MYNFVHHILASASGHTWILRPISGAFCVCIATALLQTAGLIPMPSCVADDEGSLTWDDVHLDMIRKWSAAAESLIHGRASGLDAAVCTYGWFLECQNCPA